MFPLLSIIIPLYFVEAYIVNCMNSFHLKKKMDSNYIKR